MMTKMTMVIFDLGQLCSLKTHTKSYSDNTKKNISFSKSSILLAPKNSFIKFNQLILEILFVFEYFLGIWQ